MPENFAWDRDEHILEHNVTSDQWRRIKELFAGAVDRGRDDRAAFLAGACGADQGLRAEVDRLLKAHDEASGFIDRSLLTGTMASASASGVLSRDAVKDFSESRDSITAEGLVAGTLSVLAPEVLPERRPTSAATSGRWVCCCTRWPAVIVPSLGNYRREGRCSASPRPRGDVWLTAQTRGGLRRGLMSAPHCWRSGPAAIRLHRPAERIWSALRAAYQIQ